MKDRDVFHQGELLVQERAGEGARAAQIAAGIADVLTPGATRFLAAQRMIAIASLDESGFPQASILLGEPGLIAASGRTSVTVDLTKVFSDRAEPLWSNLRPGAAIGLLAIDLATRRRFRINGHVSSVTPAAVEVEIDEAFGNCPKYIQSRRLADQGGQSAKNIAAASGTALDAERLQLIARSDTVFVASQHPSRGLDVSHRGGAPGFVRALDASTLRVPDYPGNSLFQTLGNLAIAPAAGLAILDFDHGRLLQLSGEVTLRLDLPDDPAHPSGGTGRYWDFAILRWVERPLPGGVRWQLVDRSPYNPEPAEG